MARDLPVGRWQRSLAQDIRRIKLLAGADLSVVLLANHALDNRDRWSGRNMQDGREVDQHEGGAVAQRIARAAKLATIRPRTIKDQVRLPVVAGSFAVIKSGSLICDRNASYRAKNAASTSPGLRHLGSTRRGLSPNSQALARVYKTFACSTSSASIAARGSSTRRLRAHSAVCLIKTSKSGKRKPSRSPIDAVAITNLRSKTMRQLAQPRASALLTPRKR